MGLDIRHVMPEMMHTIDHDSDGPSLISDYR